MAAENVVFLQVNGYQLEFDDLEAYRFSIGLYERGRMRFSDLALWLRGHAVHEQG
ncbi:MAG TPA: hypothetical protein VKG25_23560 [Bryobacteraceae bacterium]|nr:hypothetical protein [Bryobacteraceae bacterium]